MDFQLGADERELQETARRFAERELIEIARHCEETGEPPSRQVLDRYAGMGFLGVNIPAEYGGAGLTHMAAVLVVEELAKVSNAVAFPVFESCFGPAQAIRYFAPEAMRKRLLPRVCDGSLVIAVGMSEPDAGTGLTDLKTRARQDGGTWILDGMKRWTSGGGHAGGYVVYCRMSDAPGASGIGALYVEKGAAGFTSGRRESHMGLRGIGSGDLYFDNVRVPAGDMVVEAGGFKRLMAAFSLERCGNTTMSLACAQSAFDLALGYVQERRQFGKPIMEFQAVQMKLADMKVRVDAARLLLYRAVVNAGHDLPSPTEASIAKCFANEISREVTGHALQLFGGYGYSKSLPMEQKMRDAWGWGIAGGTIDIQKVNLAGGLVGRRFNQRA